MKNYALACTSKDSTVIEHLAVSDRPLHVSQVGHPRGHDETHRVVSFEFEADRLVPARELIGTIELSSTALQAVVRDKASGKTLK